MTSPPDTAPVRTQPGRDGPSYRFVEHGGEVEIELTAPSPAGIFEAALAAFGELVTAGRAREPTRRTIELAGRDRCLLLVDWLNELLYLAEVEHFIPVEVVTVELTPDSLRATVEGRLGMPRPILKGVALTDLRFACEGGVWHGHAVLDV